MKLLTVVKLLLLVKLTVADGSGDRSDYGEPDDWHPGDGPLVSDDEDGSGDRQDVTVEDIGESSNLGSGDLQARIGMHGQTSNGALCL